MRIFAIGEGQAGEMFDYGWIEDVDKGSRVWEMQAAKTAHAGGAGCLRIKDGELRRAQMEMRQSRRFPVRMRSICVLLFQNFIAMLVFMQFIDLTIAP